VLVGQVFAYAVARYGLGMGESEALRVAFMDYAKPLSIVTEQVHGRL